MDIVREVTLKLPEAVNPGQEFRIFDMFTDAAGILLETSTDEYHDYVLNKYNHYLSRFHHHGTAITCTARCTWAGYLLRYVPTIILPTLIKLTT